MKKTYTWTGINIKGEIITRTVEAEERLLSGEEKKALDQRTREDCRALGAYALSNPEIPVH